MKKIKSVIPWWLKILSKLILSRLPVSYNLWKSIGLFEHGQMESIEYSFQVFEKHFSKSKLPPQFISLELGPGDSLLSALIAKAHGGSVSYLVDSGNYANQNLEIYKSAEKFLKTHYAGTITFPDTSSLNSLKEICDAYSCHYLTSGLASLKLLETESIDFIWSQAVLEHVRQAEFLETMVELRRILKPNGICSHVVDLRDHLGGALNNLRFTDKLWESDFMASSGFYTNRIRYSEMLDIFSKAEFLVEVTHITRWEALPTAKLKMADRFKSFPDSELCISGFSVLLKPA